MTLKIVDRLYNRTIELSNIYFDGYTFVFDTPLVFNCGIRTWYDCGKYIKRSRYIQIKGLVRSETSVLNFNKNEIGEGSLRYNLGYDISSILLYDISTCVEGTDYVEHLASKLSHVYLTFSSRLKVIYVTQDNSIVMKLK